MAKKSPHPGMGRNRRLGRRLVSRSAEDIFNKPPAETKGPTGSAGEDARFEIDYSDILG